MKILLVAIFFILATSVSSATEKAFHFDTIIKKYESSKTYSMLNLTNYNYTLFTGRCFSRYSQIATGSALAIKTVNVDSGPIGSPNEKVAFAHQAYSSSPSAYDNMTYSQLIAEYYPNSPEFFESFYIQDHNIWAFNAMALASDSDGIIYGVKFNEQNDYYSACYFFKQN